MRTFIAAAGFGLAITVAVWHLTAASADQPAGSDPPGATAVPASMSALTVESQGSRMSAMLYQAAGEGPHPTAVLLHGFPGYERNLDLAQDMRQAGVNVLFFHYRGSWGSEGNYRFGNLAEDTAAALAFLRSDAASDHRVDSNRLFLVGHSMGGFAALMAAANDPAVRCVAAISPANLSAMAVVLAHPDGAEMRTGFAAMVDQAVPLQVKSGSAVVSEMIERGAEWDLRRLASRLRGRPLLLIGAERDRVLPVAIHQQPLLDAYSADPEIQLTSVMLSDDHAYSNTRDVLSRQLVDWLASHCMG